MALREEAKKIIAEIFGQEVAKQVDRFERPEDYPKDFLDECVFFMGKLIGEDAAKKKFEPLYKKYATGERRLHQARSEQGGRLDEKD